MENKKIFTRYTAVIVLFILTFSAIVFKLADIQIVQGEDFRRQAEDKSIRTVDDEAPRGKILDRNGVELATDVQSYTIFMMRPQKEDDKEKLNIVIERLLGILNSRNEKINDDFCITTEKDQNGKYSFKFNFPNNYTDKNDIDSYIEKASKRWKAENGMDGDKENYTAEQAFYFLKDKYGINPVQKENDNVSFIRQMIVIRQMLKERQYEAYKPVEIAYVSRDTAFEIMEKNLYLPGVDYQLKPLRVYPYKDLASVVIGSLRKIPGGTEAQNYIDKHYDVSSDLIGRDGIEAYAEEDLRGEKGGRTVKVDALGRIVEELGKRDPIPGNNVVLTLDKELQQVAEKSLDDVMEKLRSGELDKTPFINATRGAAVVIDVKTGEVLAMASRPGGYDPNVMAATGSFNEEVRKFLIPLAEEHPGVLAERIPKPMYNYATTGKAPPGSTFKMVSAIAGLETGAITPNEIIRDLGEYKVVKNFPGACWIWNYHPGQTHGNLNVSDALKVSCNYFFFEVGHRVKLANLAKYAKMFGLSNEPTGIEIYENPGNVANPEDVKKRVVYIAIDRTLKDICQPGYDKNVGTFKPTTEQTELIKSMITNNDTDSSKLKAAGITSVKIRSRILEGVRAAYREYNNQWMELNAAIGQGDDNFTPLQIANYVATIANGGTRMRPHLVKSIISNDGSVLKEIQPEVMNKVELKPTTLAAVIKGMDAVTGEGGTAGAVFRNFPIKVAGKTGTAQASGGMDDYSWFAGFAPAENPQIAVAVVIYEGGGHGGADVARDIFSHYFKLDTAQPNP